MEELLEANGIDISKLGLDEDLVNDPVFVENVSFICTMLRKERYLLTKKLEKLQAFRKRQTEVLEGAKNAYFIVCESCGINVMPIQNLIRTCDCTNDDGIGDTIICDWCFDEGKYPKLWRKIRGGFYWCNRCNTKVTPL